MVFICLYLSQVISIKYLSLPFHRVFKISAIFVNNLGFIFLDLQKQSIIKTYLLLDSITAMITQLPSKQNRI